MRTHGLIHTTNSQSQKQICRKLAHEVVQLTEGTDEAVKGRTDWCVQ